MYDIGDVIYIENIKYHQSYIALVTNVGSYCDLYGKILEADVPGLRGRTGYLCFSDNMWTCKLNGNRLVVEQCIK